MTRLISAVAIAVLVCLTLAGCWNSGNHPDATADPSEIVGNWSGPTTTVETSPTTEAISSISFAADGTFSATAIPQSVLCGPVYTNDWGDTSSPNPNTTTVTSTGTWKPYTSDKTSDFYHGVSMVWQLDNGAGELVPSCDMTFRLETLDGEVKLFTWIGDPDSDETVTLTRSPLLPLSTPAP
jgi:hypothetical protein